MAQSLPPGFFDKPSAGTASSASISGRVHAVEGFFDQPTASSVGEKRGREEEEEEDGPQEEVEEEEEDEDEEEEEDDGELNIDKMLDEAEPAEIMDLPQLKRLVLALDRKIAKNQEMRIKHPDEPSRFMESEVELFEEISKMQALATAPELYTEFVKLNGAAKVVELLDHENNDITLAAVELIVELTDTEALIEADAEEGAKALVDALVENAFLELLIRNLAKLDEAEEDAQKGVYNTLQIIENLSELSPQALEALTEKTDVVGWLFKRLLVKAFEQNKLYSSEILSILCQTSVVNQRRVASGEGMDRLLQLVNAWKKKDPKDGEEVELVENLFNVLCSCLMVPENQAAFVEGEGVELLVIMLQARKFAARCALKVLDYSMQRNSASCERFVNAMGLKTLFPGFLRPQSIFQSKNKEGKGGVREDEEHCVSIVSSLLLRLAGDNHTRVVQKFVEKDFEKVDRLVELHEKYYAQVASHDKRAAAEEDEDEDEDDGLSKEERRYLSRLDQGLFTLQQVDTTMVFLLSEGVAGIESRVKLLLHQSGSSLQQMVEVLEEYHNNVGEDKVETSSDALNMKEVTGDLVAFLKDYIAEGQ